MPAAIDLPLALLTVWVAWRALSDPDLFGGVVLFMVFGLLMSLVWVRVGAEDVALAEAAIGAGLTGALFLDAVRTLPADGRSGAEGFSPAGEAEPRWLASGSGLLTIAFGASLAVAAVRLEAAPGGLTSQVREALERSGVDQPVTAVLVNIRGYDTLLEMAVLLLAAAGMLAARRSGDITDAPGRASAGPVPDWLARLLLPALALTAAHLLLAGTHRAGGAFQAGAVLASAAILLHLTGHRSVAVLPGAWLRGALLLGFAVFLGCAVGLMFASGRLLEFSPRSAPGLILLIETGLALSTAVTLAALFVGARAPGTPPGR